MLKTLRKRFVLITMAIVTGMLLIIFGLVIHFTNLDLNARSDTLLQQIAQNALDPSGQEPNSPLPYFTLRFSTFGQVTASGKTHFNITDKDFLDELIGEIYDINKNTGYLEEYSLKYTVVTSPMVQVIAFVDVSSQHDSMVSLLQVSILTAAAALAAFTLLSILLARWAVRPVDKAWNQQKQFISDASHELKTPLTVIISNAELLQNQDTDPTLSKENILSASRQMRHLVEGMLELARADNGQIASHFETADLSKAVTDSLLPFEPVFFESGHRLESAIEPNILVCGSVGHLRQLTDILLDNAQKYSGPGIVEVKLSRQGKNQCLLTVANPGNPIPSEELESIFRRFYRSDTARTSSGSFGLGLSIAQRIAEEHGGKIWAESNPSGNRFSVLLPCYPNHAGK